jgi:hypothetical protein
MSEVPGFDGSALVTNWFGYWPSLHDAEVLSVALQRSVDRAGPGVYVRVHAFEMTSEITPKGYFKLVKHCIIELRFEQIGDLDLRHFGYQNVIDGISLSCAAGEDSSRRIAVEFGSLSEMQLSFSCAKAVVVSLTPGLPSEGIYTVE